MLKEFTTPQLNLLAVEINDILYPNQVNKVKSAKVRLENTIEELKKELKVADDSHEYEKYYKTNKEIEKLNGELIEIENKKKFENCYQFQGGGEIFSLQRGKLSKKFIGLMKEFANVTDEELKDRETLREKLKEFKYKN